MPESLSATSEMSGLGASLGDASDPLGGGHLFDLLGAGDDDAEMLGETVDTVILASDDAPRTRKRARPDGNVEAKAKTKAKKGAKVHENENEMRICSICDVEYEVYGKKRFCRSCQRDFECAERQARAMGEINFSRMSCPTPITRRPT